MALTAWEAYVEERVAESVNSRLGADVSQPALFMKAKLKEELKRFHNPTSDETRNLFRDYLDINVVSEWRWQHMDPAREGR